MLGRLCAFVVVFVITWTCWASEARAEQQPEHCPAGWESSVFLKAKSSVVRITDGGGWGAGFLWKTSHRIVTAMHVVARARSYDIIFADGTKGRAHLVAGDERNDVAILELDSVTPAGLEPLELADPASLAVGEPVIAIGHPRASAKTDPRDEGLFAWSVTRGVLSARNDHRVQIDARLDHGNSGGPILDCEGRVIGVASHIIGSLNFATAPRDIVELDQNPRLPGVSFAPTGDVLRLGLMVRQARFASYGPLLEGGVTFFGKLAITVRVSGLFSVTSEASGDRMISGRSGLHGWGGAGWGFRLLGSFFVPHVGVSTLLMREHATRIVGSTFVDASASSAAARFAPGLTALRGLFWFDYKLETDFGRFADSAHLFALGVSFR